MARPRFSLASLLGSILLIGFGFTALRTGTVFWYQTTYTIVLLVLLTAVLAARAWGCFWFGFAVFGWGYFLLSAGPWFDQGSDFRTTIPLNKSILTTFFINEVCEILIHKVNPDPADPQWQNQFSDHAKRILYTTGIAQLLLVPLFGLAGGVIARSIQERSDIPPES